MSTSTSGDSTRTTGGSRLPTLIFMVWRNIWRNPARSGLTVAALAGSLVLLLLYLGLVAGMTRQMVDHATDLALGHMQLHRQAFVDDQDLYATLPWSTMEKLETAFPDLSMAPRLYASALASAGEASNGVLIKAVDPQREPRVTRLLEEVREGTSDLGPAPPTDAGLPRHHVLIGAQLARNMNITPGAELILVTQAADASIGNALYQVAGVLKPIEPAFDRQGVLMSIGAFQSLMVMDQGFHELSFKLKDVSQLDAVQAAVAAKVQALTAAQPLDKLGGPPLLRNWRQIAPALADMISMYDGVVWVIGLIVVALAALGMVNTMIMAIHERTREFGVLRAIGMDKRWLLVMVLIESLLLALISAVLGVVAALVLIKGLLKDGIDLSASMPDGFDMVGIVIDPVMPMQLEPMHVIYAALLVIAITMIAALLPSWRVMRVKPAESMR